MPRDENAYRLAELARQLAQPATEGATAQAVITRALEHVEDADAASITLQARRNTYKTLASSGELPERLDELQYSLKEGPCVSVADGHDWYRSGDISRDERWPRWGPVAGELGVGSLLSVRLLVDDSPIGALNFYAQETGRFSDRDGVDFAILYATHAAIALTSNRQVNGLETALHSRHLIGMAQGILIARFGLDIDRSFDLLRRYSSTTNTKLSVVAQEIVRTGQLPSTPEDTQPNPARHAGTPGSAQS